MNRNFLLSISIIILFIQSCGLVATRPKLEMSLAQAAFIAAKEANSAQFSPSLFRKAELAYLKAKSAYRSKLFDKAKRYAKASIYYAERAEVKALKQQAFEANDPNGVFNENF